MSTLTTRQSQVLNMLLHTPLTKKQIAGKLFVTYNAIVVMSRKIFLILGVSNRVDLILKYHVDGVRYE